jgi:hypothetical protein
MHVGLAPVVKNVFLHVFDSCLDPVEVDWYNAEFGLEQGDVVDQVLAQRCFIRDEIFSDVARHEESGTGFKKNVLRL